MSIKRPSVEVLGGQKEYSFWRTTLIVGLILWPFLFFFVVLGAGLIGAGGGGAARNYQANGWILTTAALLALPISLVSLIVAIYFRKNSNVRAAIHTLQIPFYYLLVVIGIQICLEYLSSFY